MKNIPTTWWIAGIAVLIIGLFASSRFLQSSDPDVVARSGMHSHPQLEIYVKGEKVDIPQNIGLGAVHKPIHTHDDLPLIHLEFSGMVRSDDIILGRFFENWGRDIRSFGENMHMTVNGVESTEYERYIMKDGDRIELRYE
ncbi:MAG: hypothetical protein AAB605_00045 [Patescibacteria group bacterium]